MKITENALVPVTGAMVEAVQDIIGASDIQVIESLMEIVTKDVDAIKERVIQTKVDSAKIVDVTEIPKYVLDVPSVMEAITKELNAIARKRKDTFNSQAQGHIQSVRC